MRPPIPLVPSPFPSRSNPLVLWAQSNRSSRLVDLLSDINSSSQIPLEKRISVPTSPPRSAPTSPQPQKTLATLESEVPHMPLDKAKEAIPDFLQDVTPAPGEDAPAPFLTVDELENYLLEVDQRIGLPKLATLAPASKEPAPGAATSATRDFLLKHPHSAYNWLKVNAPHVFLQGDDEDGKKGKGEKGKGGGARGGKRGKAAREKEEREAGEMSVDEEGADGQRKRKRDDGDAGYRPKGGSGARPAKRKRKSEGGEVKRRRTGGEKAE